MAYHPMKSASPCELCRCAPLSASLFRVAIRPSSFFAPIPRSTGRSEDAGLSLVMNKKGIPSGAVVRGNDKGYDHAPPKPGSERPVDQIHEGQKYPYMRPRDA